MSGAGTSTQQQQQTQSQKSQPWAPAVPLLQSQLGQIGNMNLGPSGGQQAAAGNMVGAAGGLPNFSGQATDLANNLFGYNTNPQQQYYSQFMQPGYLDPMSNPYLGKTINSLNQQIASGVKDQFAGAGRDPSGNAQAPRAIAYGESQADLPLLLGQYNTNVQQGNTAAQGLTGSQLAGFGVNQQGLGAASSVPGLALQPGQAQLGAATTQAQLPLINALAAEQATIPIAGLGGQSQGQGTSNTQNTMSPLQQMQMMSSMFSPGGGVGGAWGILGGLGI